MFLWFEETLLWDYLLLEKCEQNILEKTYKHSRNAIYSKGEDICILQSVRLASINWYRMSPTCEGLLSERHITVPDCQVSSGFSEARGSVVRDSSSQGSRSQFCSRSRWEIKAIYSYIDEVGIRTIAARSSRTNERTNDRRRWWWRWWRWSRLRSRRWW